jgi:hypothetical protein
MLCELYDRFTNKRFEDGMADFAALAELLAENNAPEVRALKKMVEAETELNQVRAAARNL